MANFMAVTASNGPKLKDQAAVERIIDRYFVDPDFNVGVRFEPATAESYLYIYGYLWPEAWKVPDGVEYAHFNPYTDDLYEVGADGFVELLKELAPYLAEPLTVQAVGSIKCCFPLSACEWYIEPNSTEVEFNEFQHGDQEATVSQEGT